MTTNKDSVTLGNTQPRGGIDQRHAPDLTCHRCHRLIPRDQPVSLVCWQLTELGSMLGIPMRYIVSGAGELCEPCWQDTVADPDDEPRQPVWQLKRRARWRLAGDWRYRIAGYGNVANPFGCVWCGRPDRRIPACSKRCQVYHSQDRHGRVKSRDVVYELRTVECVVRS